MTRRLEPELLDELPPENPEAARSRRDLRRVNAWMQNPRWLAESLRRLPRPPSAILELGAGDGHFMLQTARRLAPVWNAPVNLWLLDRQNLLAPDTWSQFERLGWHPRVLQLDLRDWLQSPEPVADVITANLFLHHFEDADLRRLFEVLARTTRAFIACEPRRWRIAILSTRLLWLIGCNRVTRHDAIVSVRAGFRERELSALWPEESGFTLRESPAGFASHLFAAQRLG